MEKEYKVGFFEENEGEMSMMRLLCFISLFFGVSFAVTAIVMAALSLALAAQYALIFAFGFLGSSIFGKTFQKIVEMNPNILNKG